MVAFKVNINGTISGVAHRFSGGNGDPEIYSTTDAQEIYILDVKTEDSIARRADGSPTPRPATARKVRVAMARVQLMEMDTGTLERLADSRGVLKKNRWQMVDALLRQI